MIPFNLLPVHKLEYTFSGGLVEDNGAGFLRGIFNYGVSRRITIGSGVEYLSSAKSSRPMPFINTSLRISSRLLFSGEYSYGVRSRGIFTYYGPSNLHVQLSYTRYTKGQDAIYFNYVEERKGDISIPFHLRKVRIYSQLTINQILLLATKYTSAKFLLSGSFGGIGVNLTNYALFLPFLNPYLYGDLSLSFKLPLQFIFSPQAQYNYDQAKLILVKGVIEKPIGQLCFINVSCERNLLTQINSIELGMRFNFSFSQASVSVRRSNDDMIMSQSARGSMIYDKNTKSLTVNTHNNVGKGGITLIPFLDMNDNGKRDQGEPKVSGMKPRIRGGIFEYDKSDSSFRALNLTPYVQYLIEAGQNNFETVSWQIKNKLIKVTVDPNNLKLIEIPVSVKGEASGMIYKGDARSKKGIGRIRINFYSNDSTLVFSTLSEEDGYFSLLGFAPGSYVARIDQTQLDKLHMAASPSTVSFDIVRSREGGIADGLEFIIAVK